MNLLSCTLAPSGGKVKSRSSGFKSSHAESSCNTSHCPRSPLCRVSFEVFALFGRLEIRVDWELQLLASSIHGSTWAAPHPVIGQPQLAREGVLAVHTKPIVARLTTIPKSAASALQLQLYVDAPPDSLHHPPLRISVDEIRHLILVRPGRFTLGSHHLQGEMEVNCKEQCSFRRKHGGGIMQGCSVANGEGAVLSLHGRSRAHSHGPKHPKRSPTDYTVVAE